MYMHRSVGVHGSMVQNLMEWSPATASRGDLECQEREEATGRSEEMGTWERGMEGEREGGEREEGREREREREREGRKRGREREAGVGRGGAEGVKKNTKEEREATISQLEHTYSKYITF